MAEAHVAASTLLFLDMLVEGCPPVLQSHLGLQGRHSLDLLLSNHRPFPLQLKQSAHEPLAAEPRTHSLAGFFNPAEHADNKLNSQFFSALLDYYTLLGNVQSRAQRG